MLLPLGVLALLAMVAGVLNLPFSKKTEFLGEWLYSAKIPGSKIHAFVSEHHSTPGWTKVILAFIAVACGVAGIAGGIVAWRKGDVNEKANLENPLLKRAYGVDNFYSNLFEKPGFALSNALAFIVDRKGIDGVVNGVGLGVRSLGGQLRRLQTGYVRNYALGLVGGLVALLAWAIYRGGM